MSQVIDGVIVTQLKLVTNERGRLMEVQRHDDDAFPGFGQVYITQTFPGVTKAWYRHRHQIDQIAAISGSVRLVLYDDRPGSQSREEIMEIMLGELQPQLVLIPPGIWHGFRAESRAGATLLHLNSRPYDPDNLDEDRLDPVDSVIPYHW